MNTIVGFANACSGGFHIGVEDSNIQKQMIEKYMWIIKAKEMG